MNELTHFFFGYLIARFILKKKNNQFETFFLSMSALIPDFDIVINFFIPFEHGVFSHTFLGGLLFSLIYTSIIWMMGKDCLKELDLSFFIILELAIVGMLSHLLLDSFTYYYSYESSHASHMYFWPLWNFPFHINTMFPEATWEIRVLVEVFFSLFLIIIILVYGWIIKKENPFLLFSPKQWGQYFPESSDNQDHRIGIYTILVLNLMILSLLLLNYIL
ncbi:MAG: metal-dependent hydrolase [Promethearchaeota archaeon]